MKLILDVPLIGQKIGYDNKPLMQPDASGVQRQHGFMACWYASACMVSYFYKAGPRLGMPTVWKADDGLTISAINELARIEGLSAVPKPQGGFTEQTVYGLLNTRGPLWAAGRFLDQYPDAGHAIVLTGIDGPFIHYNDPWEPKAKKRAIEWFRQRIFSLPNAILAKVKGRS